MAKKIVGQIKLQIGAQSATPQPPIGPALGQHSVNIMAFCKAFNAETANVEKGLTVPTVITVYADRTFSFITKTPPAAVLLLKKTGIKKGSGEPNKTKVGNVSDEIIREIAEMKMPDLNAASIETAMNSIKGTAKSMGLVVEGE